MAATIRFFLKSTMALGFGLGMVTIARREGLLANGGFESGAGANRGYSFADGHNALARSGSQANF